MRTFTILFVAVAGLATACEPGPVSDTEGRSPNGELPTRTRDVPVSKAVDVARVAWPDQASVDAATLVRLPAEAQNLVPSSSVPVLLPRAEGLAGATRLIVKPVFTAASMTGTGEHLGLTVSVSATRVSHRYADIPPAKGPARVRGGKEAFITQNEGIWSVTWFEHGVSYVLEVECERPGDDARCADDAFIKTLVEDLTFVGGAFDGGAQ